MNDIAGRPARPSEGGSDTARRVLGIISGLALAFSWLALTPPTANAAELSAVTLYGPTNRTTSTISVRFDRVVESAGTCQGDIGYEFDRGQGWVDAGSFSGAACAKSYAGYKFSGLAPGTGYDLSVRAYRVVDGTKTDFSLPSTISGSTLGTAPTGPTPTPNPSPTQSPTPSPSAAPSPTPTSTPSPSSEPTSTPSPTEDPTGLSAPVLKGPTNRTNTTISVKLGRVPQSGTTCRADIGYEFNRGAGWMDAGTFGGSACNTAQPGYKFTGLAHGTSYDFQVRAYLLVGGVKAEFSPVATLTASTTGEPGTAPTPTPTPNPTGEPTASPSPSPTGRYLGCGGLGASRNDSPSPGGRPRWLHSRPHR